MKILMINVPYQGHTNPTLLLSKLLVEKGHEVFYINAEEFRAKIENTGATFIPYINFPDKLNFQQKKMRCFKAAFDTAMQVQKKFDLLIYEMFFYPGFQIAKNLGIPVVRQFSQPAWNKDIIEDVSFSFGLSCKIIDAQIMGKKKAQYMNLENKCLIDAVLYDKPNLNIVYVPKIFQHRADTFDDSYLFTIPIQNYNQSSKIEIPYDKMKYPIVYISLGSIISSKSFYNKCIKAFKDKPYSVIISTGKVKPESLKNIPENIYAYSFVPQLEVLQHTSVFITHCGMNSVNEAIANGVPMLTLPVINDQISNAQRIVNLKIGIRIKTFFSTAQEIFNGAQEIATNPMYKTNTAKIKDLVKNDSTMDEIISKIEKLV